MKFVSCEEDSEFYSAINYSCIYCGDMSGGIVRDHVIPVAWSGRGRDYNKGDTVNCCKECNSRLSDVPIMNVPARAFYLYNRYLSLWGKQLSFPDWSEEELAEISDDLKSSILSNIERKNYLRDRMQNLINTSSQEPMNFDVRQVTESKASVYKVLTAYLNLKGKEANVITDLSKGLSIDRHIIKNIISENKIYKVDIASYKWDLGIPLDTSIKSLRSKS